MFACLGFSFKGLGCDLRMNSCFILGLIYTRRVSLSNAQLRLRLLVQG